MPGSPKKRARRLAEEEAARKAAREQGKTATADVPAPPALAAPVVQGEILPPAGAEPTRTALKRAMRRKAQEFADVAIGVLGAALTSDDEKVRIAAARELLDRGYGKPEQEVEAGEGAQMIVIRRFGDPTNE